MIKLLNGGILMKTKIISNIQNQMKPFLNQSQYIKLTNVLLNTLKDIEIIDKNNDLNQMDNHKMLNLFYQQNRLKDVQKIPSITINQPLKK